MRTHSKKIASIIAAGLILCAVTAFAQDTLKFNAEATFDNINIRSDSNVSSDIICVLKKHDSVEVIGELYDWYKIHLPKNAPSFVKKSLFICLPQDMPHPLKTPIPANSGTACASAKALKDRINVRLKPDEASQILGKINKDEIVSVLGDANGWLQIEPVQNSFGYVYKKMVRRFPVPGSIPEPGLISITGIVQPYGKIFGRKATHKLVSEDKIYLLKGNKESLDSINYQRVKVAGNITGLKQKYPIIEIISIETADLKNANYKSKP